MDRRNFLTLGAPKARSSNPRIGTAFRQGSGTQNLPVFMSRSSAGLEPYSGPWGYAQAAHLLRRCMVGPTDVEIRRAVVDGMNATVDRLLTPFEPALTLIDDWAGKDPQVRPASTDEQQAFQDMVFVHREGLQKWWHLTIATSPVSIQERLTIFWHNHFTSELQAVNLSEWMLGQNQLLRKNILGNLKQLAKDVTKDMAMLIYLDNIKNYKTGNRDSINENYARELMELFTCGVSDWEGNPNYTQDDVHEAARALSGYNFSPSSLGALYGSLNSTWVQARWDSGNKTILGKTGAWRPEDVVDIIFSERADQVAKFVCGKLYRAFVYDILDRDMVTAMADILRNGNWEIRPVIEQLLKSAHFYDETNIGAIQKSPVDYMIGIVRGWNLGISSIPDFVPATGRSSQDLRNRLNALGMTLFDPPNVKGWPGGRTWVSTSTLPTRQKFAIDVANGALRSRGSAIYSFDAIAFAKTFPDYDDIEKLAENMGLFLLNIPPSDKEKESLYETLLDGGKSYEWDIEDPDQKPAERIKKFLAAAVQLAKFQLL